MLQDGHTCIITDINGLKKNLEAKKPAAEFLQKISRSISNLDSKKLAKLYEENKCNN